MKVNTINYTCSVIIAITSFTPIVNNINTNEDINIPIEISNLFASVDSTGSKAICAAEGNCKTTGEKTDIYDGHKDPGNGKHNRGFCSDQGRSKGKIENADKGCLEYLNSRTKLLKQSFEKENINPEPEVFINAVDLWNQASPRVSDVFANKYAIAINNKQENPILWARVESFRKRNGELEAGNANIGLFGICNNPNNDYYKELNGIQSFSEEWRWKCISLDQQRRITAIKLSLTKEK